MRRLIAALALGLVVAVLTGLPVVPTAGAAGNPPITAPIWTRSFPDPEVIRVGGTWYAFGTDGPLGNVQLLSSPDLQTWSSRGNALQSSPVWAKNDDVWAPAVLALPTGSFVLYASFLHNGTGRRCVGTAIAATVAGPYTGVGDPLVCADDQGGAIDPAIHREGPVTRLLWKTEGIVDRLPPALWSQSLGADGLTLLGAPSRLLQSTEPWQGTLVENPSMISVEGRTLLFFSGNEWRTASYATGWGRCTGPQGPCATPPNMPLLTTSGASIQGPGGASAFQDETGQWWLAYAAWNGTPGRSSRVPFLRRFRVVDGRPVLQAPDGSYPAPPLTRRVSGLDRYETAVAFSRETTQAPRPVTYVATGLEFADALSAAPASGREASPVLLVEPNAVPPAVDAELRRITPGHIVVMGGPSIISEAVESQLRTYSIGLHREPGEDRFDTAARVARNTFRTPGVPVVYVATGDPFADGVAGGAAATSNGGPLLLVQRDTVPRTTWEALQALRPQRIVVLGGISSVSDLVAAQLATLAPVRRVAGVDRFETAALIAEQEYAGPIGGVVIATGDAFADAVAAGPAAFPVLLVPSTGPAPLRVRQALIRLAPLGILVVGGEAAVSSATLASLGL